jgi:hypothetical protein
MSGQQQCDAQFASCTICRWCCGMGQVYDVQLWGMTIGSCASLFSICAIFLDCVRFKQLRTLVRRPIAPLLYRSACDGVFAAQFIFAHLFIDQVPNPNGPVPPMVFPEATCSRLAFVTQVTLLAGECWYLVVSIDVIVDLIASPFNNATLRLVAYHVIIWGVSITMGIVLVTTGEAGHSVTFNWCWRKSFADEGQDEDAGLYGALYLYGQVVVIYSFSLAVWFAARFSLNKGIPRTYLVREKRIKQGKGIVLGFSVYWSVFGALYTVILFGDVDESKTTGHWVCIWLAFSLLLCSRGLVDFIIWKLYIKPAEHRDPHGGLQVSGGQPGCVRPTPVFGLSVGKRSSGAPTAHTAASPRAPPHAIARPTSCGFAVSQSVSQLLTC